MKAHVLVREQPWYRREAFVEGLRAAGHKVSVNTPQTYDRDTLVVVWNRYLGLSHQIASSVEAAGGIVIVAENGYIGAGGTAPKFDVHPAGPRAGHYYALALGWHNGRGRWYVGAEKRFPSLGIELGEWRQSGDYVLVAPNRSFGIPPMLMHPDWGVRTAERLRKNGMKVRLRDHPGNNAPKVPLEADLEGAAAVVIWSSSVGVHALARGIPVVCAAPYWIMKGAAPTPEIWATAGDEILIAACEARAAEFEKLAWAQWTVEEISAGVPFRWLLSREEPR